MKLVLNAAYRRVGGCGFANHDGGGDVMRRAETFPQATSESPIVSNELRGGQCELPEFSRPYSTIESFA